MGKHLLIIQGHPDPDGKRFGHALSAAYAEGARQGEHEVRLIDVAKLDFPILRTKEDFERGAPPESIREAQNAITWADHLVLFFPLWHGTMPALFKAFLEQVFRYGFAIGKPNGAMMGKLLTGKSARIVVTMGMPAFFYRFYFRAHGVKGLKRSILGLSGIKPIKESLIGMVEGSQAAREKWLAKMRVFGSEGN